jgi:uncharacterized membrane protein YkoI
MRARGGIGLVAVFGLLVGIAAARADEKEEKIPLSEVPKAVIDAVKAKFPGAKIEKAEKEVEDGKTYYELSLELNDDEDLEVKAKPDGTIVEIEKEIKAEDLPAAVTAALKDKYPGAKIKEAEEVTKGTTVSYEVQIVTADKKKLEVTLDKNGNILEVEEADEEKD